MTFEELSREIEHRLARSLHSPGDVDIERDVAAPLLALASQLIGREKARAIARISLVCSSIESARGNDVRAVEILDASWRTFAEPLPELIFYLLKLLPAYFADRRYGDLRQLSIAAFNGNDATDSALVLAALSDKIIGEVVADGDLLEGKLGECVSFFGFDADICPDPCLPLHLRASVLRSLLRHCNECLRIAIAVRDQPCDTGGDWEWIPSALLRDRIRGMHRR